MRVQQQRWGALAITALVMWPGISAAQAVQADSGSIFSADVTVETSVVDPGGVVVEQRPQTRYRLTVRRVNGVRQTEIAYAPGKLFPRGPLVDPRGGYRLVFDDGSEGPRIYDPTGALVAGAESPAAAAPEQVSARASTSFVFEDSAQGTRRQDLRRRFGRTVGKVAGRDRYVEQLEASTTETLVEPSSQLPVEINVVKQGTLEQRTTFSYGRMPRGRWYMATERDEALMPGTNGRRLVTQKTFTNVLGGEDR